MTEYIILYIHKLKMNCKMIRFQDLLKKSNIWKRKWELPDGHSLKSSTNAIIRKLSERKQRSIVKTMSDIEHHILSLGLYW